MAPGLTLVGAHATGPDGPLSATGIGSSAASARARCQSEQAEAACLPPRSSLSGIAAHPDAEHAALNAIEELIERWLVGRWWQGAIPAQTPDPLLLRRFDQCSRDWSCTDRRQRGLAALTASALPTVMVAWSCNHEHRAIAFGAACRIDPSAATRAALRELCQMEFSLGLILTKAARGERLTKRETASVNRAQNLILDDVTLPSRGTGQSAPHGIGDGTMCGSDDLLDGLKAAGLAADVASARSARADRHVAIARPVAKQIPFNEPAPSGWAFYI
ncbi:MAG: YcaO-like family protein [Pseudomonadota bacterium]